MNKVRLVRNGEVVGFQESRRSGFMRGLTPQHSRDNRQYYEIVGTVMRFNYIAHDAEDRSTGIVAKGVEIYENDEVSYIDTFSDDYIINKHHTTFGIVKWIPGKCGLYPQEIKENAKGGHYIAYWDQIIDLEVIGRAECGL